MWMPQALYSGYLLAGIVALASSECKQGVLGAGPAGPRLRTSRGPEPRRQTPAVMTAPRRPFQQSWRALGSR